MADPTPTQQLEEVWRLRLSDAQLRLQFARNYMQEVHRDLQEGVIPAADGNFALERAIRAENIAIAEYSRVLRFYTDLVVDGKIPEEESGDTSAAHG